MTLESASTAAVPSGALPRERVITAEEAARQKHWIVIRGGVYDVSGYLERHPGGRKVFERFFYGGNATGAFERARHTKGAHKLLQGFQVGRLATAGEEAAAEAALNQPQGVSRLRKFFTHEDRFQIHKVLGLYVLLHFVYRHALIVLGHPHGGFDGSLGSLLSVIPHGFLSGSSLLFHVPRETVKGRPMIWQEFRAHSITFTMRSFFCFVLLWVAERAREQCWGQAAVWRGASITGAAGVLIATMLVADEATRRLRADARESTIGTAPFWEGCSSRTQAGFKAFYSLAQVAATLGLLAMVDLSWPFAVMLPIQLVALLLTCVRKGALSTRGFHYIYAGSLLLPPVVLICTHPELLGGVMLLTVALYGLRLRFPRGAARAKYALWGSAAAVRIGAFAAVGV